TAPSGTTGRTLPDTLRRWTWWFSGRTNWNGRRRHRDAASTCVGGNRSKRTGQHGAGGTVAGRAVGAAHPRGGWRCHRSAPRRATVASPREEQVGIRGDNEEWAGAQLGRPRTCEAARAEVPYRGRQRRVGAADHRRRGWAVETAQRRSRDGGRPAVAPGAYRARHETGNSVHCPH